MLKLTLFLTTRILSSFLQNVIVNEISDGISFHFPPAQRLDRLTSVWPQISAPPLSDLKKLPTALKLVKLQSLVKKCCKDTIVLKWWAFQRVIQIQWSRPPLTRTSLNR